MSRSYALAETVSDEVTFGLEEGNELTRQLLVNRGIITTDDARAFLAPDYNDRHDPFLLPNMEAAVARVLRAIESNEKILIYADYDCDGIPGAVILHDFFSAAGFSNFTEYIPHRHFEGFGFNVEAVKKFSQEGVNLIITVDCGTGDYAAIEAAAQQGIDVIITDHHLPPPAGVSEAAYAVVNPKLEGEYPFKDLCGAGVVFKLVEALIARGNFNFIPGREKWWLDMVGLATIGDLVPLVGENRVFARYGLEVLRKSRRLGIRHLMRKTRTSQRHLTEDDIGFTIAPRINAASRMDTPQDAFRMLVALTDADAGARVDHLERLNNERKGLVASMTKELKKRIQDMTALPSVLVLGNPEWRPALAGLAANSLAETYKRPAFIWGRDGNGLIRGSCRSEGETSVATLMNAASDLFVEHGGHHFSGGFTVKEEHTFTFGDELNTAYERLGNKRGIEEIQLIDASLSLEEVTDTLVATLSRLAPYGVGNPKPLFEFNNVVPTRVDLFGKSKEHLKLTFNANGRSLEAIAFFKTIDSFARVPTVETPLRLIAHVEQSFFMNRLQIRLRIVDIL